MKPLIHPKPFYFIRHGESEWNVAHKFAGGGVDTPLTDLGRAQAQDAMHIFESLSPAPSSIIHSPLSRAKDTAIILNQNRRLCMTENDNLREIMAGEWAGLHYSIPLQKWADGEKPDDGESLGNFAERLQKAFNDILMDDGIIVPFISAHGRIINGLDHLYGIAPRSLQIQNCQILRFEPSANIHRRYPWDVYIYTNKNGQIIDELANWSQI